MTILRGGVDTIGAIGLAELGGNAAVMGGSYSDRVLGYGPIGYWPMWETAGLTAECLVNSPAQDGTYAGVTLNSTTGPDGNPAGLWDGNNDQLDIHTAALQGAFDGSEGTAAIWLQAANAGIWTDGAIRVYTFIEVNGNNFVNLARHFNNNSNYWQYEAGGVQETDTRAGFSGTAWIHIALTWSATADEVRFYHDGAQSGATAGTLGAWAGNISRALVGALNAGVRVWHGYLAHAVLFDYALGGPAIADIATI